MIYWPIGHPSGQDLSRYVDGNLGGREVAELLAHLESCGRCRQEVAFLRELGETARGVRPPSPPNGLLEEIVARRASGERRVLPLGPIEDDERLLGPRMAGGLVAAALVVAASLTVFLRAPEVGASASTLDFSTDAPLAGTVIQVSYRPNSELAGAERLVLRARYRQAHDRSDLQAIPIARPAVLERTDDGIYEGALRLPPSAVYAAFVVEDESGELIDANGAALWEVLVRDGSGRPLLAALRQQLMEWTNRNWGRALEAARLMRELYPNEPEAWYRLMDTERLLTEESALDNLRAVHRTALLDLEVQAAREESLSADALFSLAFYAELVGERSRHELWADRLVEEHPRHSQAVVLQVGRAVQEHFEDPTRLLEALDLLWQRVGPANEDLIDFGYATALRLGDLEAIATWTNRYTQMRPWEALEVADELIAAGASEAAETLLRRQVAAYRRLDDRHRPLTTTSPEQRRLNASSQARAFALLSQVLAARGQTADALEALERVVAGGWHAEAFALAARSYLAVGETVRALELFAKLSVDPGSSISAQDSLAKYLELAPSGFALEAARARAWSDLRRAVLRDAVLQPLRNQAVVYDTDGNEVVLNSRLEGRVTFVAFWPTSAQIAQEQGALQAFEQQLSARGVQVFNVIWPVTGLPVKSTPAGRSALPLHFDRTGSAARAFNSWRLPAYFVLDPSGRIRFRNGSLSDVLRQSEVLRETLP